MKNRVTAENDYRVLRPYLMTDPNGNRTNVAFDALGLVTGTAVVGRNDEGDSLEGFRADLTRDQIREFFDKPRHQPLPTNPGSQPPPPASTESQATPIVRELLADATTRIVYDLDRYMRSRRANPEAPDKWEPAFAATVARETHVSDLEQGKDSKLQLSFTYSDGFGREIQKKVQAEAGPLN